MNKSRKLCSEGKSLPDIRQQYVSLRNEKQRKVHPWIMAKVTEEGRTFLRQSSFHHFEIFQRQKCRAPQVSFVHVPKISRLTQINTIRDHFNLN